MHRSSQQYLLYRLKKQNNVEKRKTKETYSTLDKSPEQLANPYSQHRQVKEIIIKPQKSKKHNTPKSATGLHSNQKHISN